MRGDRGIAWPSSAATSRTPIRLLVMKAGMPTVSSGSAITTLGIISGWKITFLVCVVSSVMTPGSAADIIRRAMIRMEPALAAAKVDASMLLQVHDELIFEVPSGTEDAAMPVIVATMEGAAAPAVNLTVPIKVDAHAAHDWDGAH